MMLACNHMVRMQIQLTAEHVSALQAMAAARQVSMAKLIRAAVDSLVEREWGAADRKTALALAMSVAGRFKSSAKDVSWNHDRYLAEAYAAHW